MKKQLTFLALTVIAPTVCMNSIKKKTERISSILNGQKEVNKLHQAIHKNDSEKIETLITKYPALINSQKIGVDGNTPLLQSLQEDYTHSIAFDTENIGLLLRLGADPNLGDKAKKNTPLTFLAARAIGAYRESAQQTIKLLVVHGADVNLPAGNNGWTPLHHALQGSARGMTENTEVLKLLLDNLADRRAVSRYGNTAEDLAILTQYSSAAQFLRDYNAPVTNIKKAQIKSLEQLKH